MATTYTVQPGDNLSSIAAQFGTTWQILQRLNDLANPNLIVVGQVLQLPNGAGPGPGAPVDGYVFPVEGYKGSVNLHWGTYAGASDLFAAQGTPVVAMCHARVTLVGTEATDQYGGNNVLYRGDDGLDYYCAHGDRKPEVAKGERLAPGQRLFGVGDTGNAKGLGYHLHIGIGYGIQDGTGATGGAGINFNAVEFLRRILDGTVIPDHPTTTGKYRVTGTGHLNLNVRDHPSLSATVIASLAEGTLVDADDPPVEADSRLWRHVHKPAGWAADQYLVPV